MQHTHTRHLIILLGLSGLWLATCSQAPKQPDATPTATLTHSFAPPFFTPTSLKATTAFLTLTPTPTSSPKASPFPTFTSTPVPTLTAHHWNAKTVLIRLDSIGGDGCCLYPLPPPLILYANGKLFMLEEIEVHEEWRLQIMMRILSRGEVCSLLNAIDQVGFFDYDPSTYLSENDIIPIDGAPLNYIEVNAWQSNSVALYALGHFLGPQAADLLPDYTPPPPTILPAIRDTYRLLSGFHPTGMEIYQPDRLALWIEKVPFDSNSTPWTLQSPTLANLYAAAMNKEGQPILLKGKDVKFLYQFFDQSIPLWDFTVSEGQLTYRLFAEPLLPYQDLPGLDEYNSYSLIPAPEYQKQTFPISCRPSDGIFESNETPAP